MQLAMASNSLSSLIFSLFSLLILLNLLCDSASAHSHNQTNHSPFEFIKHLQGCHKGDKLKGLHDLKKYLEKFGYLNYNINSKINQIHADDDDFDDLLEAALKTYQQNYHLTPTGILDGKTVSAMSMPRCGVADIVNGTNWMGSGKKQHQRHNRSTHFHTVSHYSFFPGELQWSKSHLTYGFLPGTRTDAINAVARAFSSWAANTHFTFSRVDDYRNADIKVSFHRGDHGDNSPFDGPGGVLAHAYAPEDGRFHYDADEEWGVGSTPGVTDLEMVALHEIGHLLGLRHSNVQGAIMWPTLQPGRTQGLHPDDIAGIKDLYNV